jgi:hypothetical protein
MPEDIQNSTSTVKLGSQIMVCNEKSKFLSHTSLPVTLCLTITPNTMEKKFTFNSQSTLFWFNIQAHHEHATA